MELPLAVRQAPGDSAQRVSLTPVCQVDWRPGRSVGPHPRCFTTSESWRWHGSSLPITDWSHGPGKWIPTSILRWSSLICRASVGMMSIPPPGLWPRKKPAQWRASSPALRGVVL